MKPLLLALALGATVALPGPARASDAPAMRAEKIKVLIVDGYSNHDWKQTTRLIRAVLEPTGLVTIDVSTSPASATAPGWDSWRPQFKDYDVVIQNYNDINGVPLMGKNSLDI